MTVPYTTPPTAVTGSTLAAADWNTKIRDSIESIARVPNVVVVRTTAMSIPNTTVTPVTWTALAAQTDTFWDVGSPSRLTCPAGLGGKYLVHTNPIWDVSATGGRYHVINKNGAAQFSTNSGGSGAWYTQSQISINVDLIPGDYVELGVWHSTGAAFNLKADVYPMAMTMTRIGV